jgi:hypothetical protein
MEDAGWLFVPASSCIDDGALHVDVVDRAHGTDGSHGTDGAHRTDGSHRTDRAVGGESREECRADDQERRGSSSEALTEATAREAQSFPSSENSSSARVDPHAG